EEQISNRVRVYRWLPPEIHGNKIPGADEDMHGPLLSKSARVLEIWQHDQKWSSNARQKLIQLGQGAHINNQGLAFGPFQHHLCSMNRKRPVQGDVAMSSQQRTQHSGKCDRTAVSKNSGERRRGIIRMRLNSGGNAAGQLPQSAIT